MQNIKIEVKGDNVIITVDKTKEIGISKSGKNKMVATTGGNVPVEGTDLKFGLNMYKPV